MMIVSMLSPPGFWRGFRSDRPVLPQM